VKRGVGPNLVSDPYLSKNLKSAELIPTSSGNGGADELRTGKVHIWATGASIASRLIDRVPEAKALPGAYTSERQAVALPKGKSSAAQKRVAESHHGSEKGWYGAKEYRAASSSGRSRCALIKVLPAPQISSALSLSITRHFFRENANGFWTCCNGSLVNHVHA
jgi:hypothetical protein